MKQQQRNYGKEKRRKTKRYRARHQTGNELLNKKTTAVVSCALPFQFGSSQTFGRLSVLVLTIFSINYMAVAIAIRLFSPYITLCALSFSSLSTCVCCSLESLDSSWAHQL
jgi:hypothetical protein